MISAAELDPLQVQFRASSSTQVGSEWASATALGE